MKPVLTVGELRAALEGVDDGMPVVVNVHFHPKKQTVLRFDCGGFGAAGGLEKAEVRGAADKDEDIAFVIQGDDTVHYPWEKPDHRS